MMIFALACFHALFLLVWFKSDAFVEWANLFGLGKIVYYQDYYNEKFLNPHLTYPLFLKMKRGGFISKLFGCPLCLSVWLSGITSIPSALLFIFDPFQLLINFFSEFSILTILILFIFGVISKLLNEN